MDMITRYGYVRNPDRTVTCEACGATFEIADGSVMRGHARRCPTAPRLFDVPAVCDA